MTNFFAFWKIIDVREKFREPNIVVCATRHAILGVIRHTMFQRARQTLKWQRNVLLFGSLFIYDPKRQKNPKKIQPKIRFCWFGRKEGRNRSKNLVNRKRINFCIESIPPKKFPTQKNIFVELGEKLLRPTFGKI